MSARIILGRDGLGDANERDFQAWVAYVRERTDVETRGQRDVQSDAYEGTEEQCDAARELIASLWEAWCAEGAPSPEVD